MKKIGIFFVTAGLLGGCITQPVADQNESVKDLTPEKWTTTSDLQKPSDNWLQDFNELESMLKNQRTSKLKTFSKGTPPRNRRH